MKFGDLQGFFALLKDFKIRIFFSDITKIGKVTSGKVINRFKLEFSNLSSILSKDFLNRKNQSKIFYFRKEELLASLERFFQGLVAQEFITFEKLNEQTWEITVNKPPQNFPALVQKFIEDLKPASIEGKYRHAKQNFPSEIKFSDIPEESLEVAKKILDFEVTARGHTGKYLIGCINMTKTFLFSQNDKQIREKIAKDSAEKIVVKLQTYFEFPSFDDKFWPFLENTIKESILFEVDNETLELLYKNIFMRELMITLDYSKCKEELDYTHQTHLSALKEALTTKEYIGAADNFEMEWKKLNNWFHEKLENPVAQQSYQISKSGIFSGVLYFLMTALWLKDQISTPVYCCFLVVLASTNYLIPNSRPTQMIKLQGYRAIKFNDEECEAINKISDQTSEVCLAIIETKDGQKIIFSNAYVKEKFNDNTKETRPHIKFPSFKELTQMGRISRGGSKESRARMKEEEKEKTKIKPNITKSKFFHAPQADSIWLKFFSSNDDESIAPHRKINLPESDLSKLADLSKEKLLNKLRVWEADIRTAKKKGNARFKVRIEGDDARALLFEQGVKDGETEYTMHGYPKGHGK